MYSVYIHIVPNNKIYVGATMNDPKYRWGNGKGYSKNKQFYRDIMTYGWNNITHLVPYDNLTKEEAKEKERELISFFNSNNSQYGYNKSKGGEIGESPSLETRLKRSASLQGKKTNRHFRHKPQEILHRKGKPVICIETQKIFPRIKDASEYYEICDEAIRKCCHKNRFTAGGYHWEFVKEKWL